MTAQTLFQLFLMIHIIGFTIFIGTTLIDYISFRQFWTQYEKDGVSAIPTLQVITKFSLLMRIGVVAAILAGVGMMAVTNGAFGEQSWMRIKFPLVILAALNGIIVRRRQEKKLRQNLEKNEAASAQQLSGIKKNLTIFHMVQILLCFTIILLSVFKFN
jgi:hypothetical protein